MSKKNLKVAQTFYPKYWSIDRVKTLVKAGKLTVEEYKQLTGEDYE